jgi:hypothetical protein
MSAQEEEEEEQLDKKKKKTPTQEKITELFGYNPNYLYTNYSDLFYRAGIYPNIRSDYMFSYTMTNAAYILHKVIKEKNKGVKTLFTGYVPLYVTTAFCSITCMQVSDPTKKNTAEQLNDVSRYKGSIFRSDHVVFYLNMYIEKDQKFKKDQKLGDYDTTDERLRFMVFCENYYKNYNAYNTTIFAYILDKLDEDPNYYEWNETKKISNPTYKRDMLLEGKHVPLCLSLSMLYAYWVKNKNIAYEGLNLLSEYTSIKNFVQKYPGSPFKGDIPSIEHEIKLLNTIVFYIENVYSIHDRKLEGEEEIKNYPRFGYDQVKIVKRKMFTADYQGKEKKTINRIDNAMLADKGDFYGPLFIKEYTRKIKEAFEKAVEVYIHLSEALNDKIQNEALDWMQYNDIMYKYKNKEQKNPINNTVIYLDLCGPHLEGCTDIWLEKTDEEKNINPFKQPFLDDIVLPETNYVESKHIVDGYIKKSINQFVSNIVDILLQGKDNLDGDAPRVIYKKNMTSLGINKETMPIVYNFLIPDKFGINPNTANLKNQLAKKVKEELLFMIKVKKAIKSFVQSITENLDVSIDTVYAANFFDEHEFNANELLNLETDILGIKFEPDVDIKLIRTYNKKKANTQNILEKDDEAMSIEDLKSTESFYPELYDELLNDKNFVIIDDVNIDPEFFELEGNENKRVLLIPVNKIVYRRKEEMMRVINIDVDMKNAILERKLESIPIEEEQTNKRPRLEEELPDPFNLDDLPIIDDINDDDVEYTVDGLSRNLFTHLFFR